ncbi:MAG: hypothetical protein N3G20_11640, partial [Verrucomicrobiae bacterium]|nr:hypothetical protein [Verrucomicrobiae bacterium]
MTNRVAVTKALKLGSSNGPEVAVIQVAFHVKVVPEVSAEAFEVTCGRQYGASAVGLVLSKEPGLDRISYSRKEQWCDMLLVVGQLVYGGEVALSHLRDNAELW